jgi:hypothetical protein
MEKLLPNDYYDQTRGMSKKLKAGKDNRDFVAQRILLLGRSGVGKTYNGCKYLLNLIKEGVFSPRRVVVISKTWKSDPSQEELIKHCQKAYSGFMTNNCMEDVDVEFLKKLFEGQKLIKETRPQELHNWMLFFDD